MNDRIIQIGSAQASPGEVGEGAIEITKHAGGNILSIPITIINGKNDGPCFWINGGIHGDEPEGILTCSMVRQAITPSILSGSVIPVSYTHLRAHETLR